MILSRNLSSKVCVSAGPICDWGLEPRPPSSSYFRCWLRRSLSCSSSEVQSWVHHLLGLTRGVRREGKRSPFLPG